MYIRINLDIDFQLKLTILIFWTKLTQIGYFRLKTEKMNITIEFSKLELVLLRNLASTSNLDFLDQIYP